MHSSNICENYFWKDLRPKLLQASQLYAGDDPSLRELVSMNFHAILGPQHILLHSVGYLNHEKRKLRPKIYQLYRKNFEVKQNDCLLRPMNTFKYNLDVINKNLWIHRWKKSPSHRKYVCCIFHWCSW